MLSYLALQGNKSGDPGLPMTDSQKAQAKQRAAAAKGAGKPKGGAPTTGTSQPSGGKGAQKGGAAGGKNPSGKGPVGYSKTTSPWAADCRDWLNGCCKRGITCWFKHTGLPKDNTRCFICGGTGHVSQDCTCPGGGKHPNKEADWATYNKKVEEEAEKAKNKPATGDDKNNKQNKKGGKGEEEQQGRQVYGQGS